MLAHASHGASAPPVRTPSPSSVRPAALRSGLPDRPLRRRALAPALLLAAVGSALAGCGGDAPSTGDPHQAFLENLASMCGGAYTGALVFEPEGDAMLTGTELLVADFRSCTPDEVQIAFHVEIEGEAGEASTWDRSRTWFITRTEEGLELRHDHREPDGSESTRTWYGGPSVGLGTATWQDFASAERSAVAGVPVGWRIEIEPGVRYRYGTTFDEAYDWMIEFDLSAPLDREAPPAWGADQPPSRNPGPP